MAVFFRGQVRCQFFNEPPEVNNNNNNNSNNNNNNNNNNHPAPFKTPKSPGGSQSETAKKSRCWEWKKMRQVPPNLDHGWLSKITKETKPRSWIKQANPAKNKNGYNSIWVRGVKVHVDLNESINESTYKYL